MTWIFRYKPQYVEVSGYVNSPLNTIVLKFQYN